MGIHINGVAIRCRDLKASAHFYEDLLGFERVDDLDTMLEFVAPTGPWPGQTDPPAPSRIGVMLDQVDDAAGTSGGMYGTVLNLSVDDVDAVVESLRDAGRGVRIEPTDEDYGVRIAAVYDPDGHEVWLTGPLKNPA